MNPAFVKVILKFCTTKKNCFQNNYCATNKTTLLSFEIRLDLISIVSQLHLHGFEVVQICEKKTETLIQLFCDNKIFVGFWNNMSVNYISKIMQQYYFL